VSRRLFAGRSHPALICYHAAVRQSLLYFVVAGLCAASAIISTLGGRVTAWTLIVVGITGVVLGLGLRSRNAGN
jgi:hypothetical protein